MASLMFGIFFILVVATGGFYIAAEMAIHGSSVAAGICRVGRSFCESPEYTGLAAAAAISLWLMLLVNGR